MSDHLALHRESAAAAPGTSLLLSERQESHHQTLAIQPLIEDIAVTMNVYLLHKIIVSVLMLVMIAGCNNDESDTVIAYLKQMTEVAVIIENARGQEGASEAADQILKKSTHINDLVHKIKSLPEPDKSKLLEQYGDSINAINQRISAALTAQAMRDADARRIISDAIIRLERLYEDG